MTTDPAVQRLIDQRLAQGLPLYVEDPAVLRHVATLLRAHEAETAGLTPEQVTERSALEQARHQLRLLEQERRRHSCPQDTL